MKITKHIYQNAPELAQTGMYYDMIKLYLRSHIYLFFLILLLIARFQYFQFDAEDTKGTFKLINQNGVFGEERTGHIGIYVSQITTDMFQLS